MSSAYERAATLLESAIARRAGLLQALSPKTDAFRLVHDEADGFPGLTVDRLADALLVEAHRRQVSATPLIDALTERFGARVPVFFKERWSRTRRGRAGWQVAGPLCYPELAVKEMGLRFTVSLTSGEHIGLFLDGRPARTHVRSIASGRRVLNLFSYTGAFGVAARAGGARSTTNVDAKRSALEKARQNYALNGLSHDTRTFLRSDVFKFLTRSAKGRQRFDLVVLDPPPASKRPGKGWFKVREGYVALAAKCLKLVSPDGLVLAGINSPSAEFSAVERMLSQAAQSLGKSIEIINKIGPDSDFPDSHARPVGRFVVMKFENN